MRIIQVLAVLSPDNVYGGPATVAVDQCRALAEAGHDVTLAAGAMGFDGPLPREFDGAPVQLFPVRRAVPKTGFAGITAPALNVWLARQRKQVDVVHVHLARDLLTLPTALQAQAMGLPTFVQTHGMVDPSSSPLAKVLDGVMTRRVLRASRRTFVLTEAEGRDVHEVAGDGVRTQVLPNGIKVTDADMPDKATDEGPLVLFLARLAPRKRPLAFVEAAVELAPEFPTARFRLVGPDEGAAQEVEELIARSGLQGRIEWVGPAGREECTRHMNEAQVYVLPSVNEPFGMTVLEAMRAGIAPIVTDTCELGPMLERTGSGQVSAPEPAALASAMRRYLQDEQLRREAGRRAFETVRSEFSMDSVRDQLLARYQKE